MFDDIMWQHSFLYANPEELLNHTVALSLGITFSLVMAHSPLLNDALAEALWAKAWGKEWPDRSSGRVSLTDIFLDDSQGVPMTTETDEDNDSVISGATTTELNYTCLHGMRSVVEACGGYVSEVQDVLVIRPEYIWLQEAIETGHLRSNIAVVVTGHPGNGS